MNVVLTDSQIFTRLECAFQRKRICIGNCRKTFSILKKFIYGQRLFDQSHL